MNDKKFVLMDYGYGEHYIIQGENIRCICENGDDGQKVVDKLNEQEEQIEYYKKYALSYLKEFPLYSDEFIKTMASIEGEDFAAKMIKDRDEIIKALKKEGLYEQRF